jgi:hypothetical protein
VKHTQADVERFIRLVDVLPSGCWYWLGARSRGGGNRKFYGSFRVGGEVVRAHRFASEALGGKECPKGSHRDHTCGFSMCVNPAHIEVVSHAENQNRKMARRKK